ncbi:glycoside hydrolase family 38 N-terminal domain-containing protein [Aestuariivivens marinum]|uniref:glycoside hydrolase family 38 N-terminal domain-containing protein n=1 Tax=Aestuariivivens marinum TaxID=2913555 RepID=UPI001F564330|nr:glycosyl hydrolase-related protein [Aestuariivivens marinum]
MSILRLRFYFKSIGFLMLQFVCALSSAIEKTPSILDVPVKIELFHGGGGHNHIQEINERFKLYTTTKNDIEGYKEKVYGRDYTYQSIREDVTKALISRASDGKLFFEIITNKIPEDYHSDSVSYLFYSNIDLNIREPFDLFINDELAVTFIANEDGTLKILSNPLNVGPEYILMKRDANNDGVGAFRLTVPTTLVGRGKEARIKVNGHRKGSRSWFMIFKVKDVVEQLKISALNEVAFSIKENNGVLHIDAPAHFVDKLISVDCDGRESEKIAFKEQGGLAKATINIKGPKENFKLFYGNESFTIGLKGKKEPFVLSDVVGKYFYHYNIQNTENFNLSIVKLYKPSMFASYSNFFDQKYENGTVSLMNSSHQDIAWMDRPEVCIILRDTLLLTPVIRDAYVRADYGFDIEDGLMLREYISRHPDSKDKITALLNKKLLSVGASYNCPYEDMYDAEDLVRQFYLGKRWVKKTFGGYDSKVYWNVDVPGKTLQFPQILKKAGVDYMVISRHAKGLFNWESPDGSSVFTYSPGHYGDDYVQLSKALSNKIKYGAEQVAYWSQYYSKKNTIAPLLSSYDMIPAIDYTDFIEAWNSTKNIKDEKEKEIPVYFPKMELMTSDEFMPLSSANATQIKTIKGERPNVWVYIHGPAHHEAISASRKASKILPAAEKFLAVANTIDPQKVPYPFKELDEAWQAKIYPDHGWGGHDGDITDDLFKAQLVKSEKLGTQLLNTGIDFIAGRIKTKEHLGVPIVLFNSLSWQRTDPVKVNLNFQKGKAKALNIITAKKEITPSQLSNIEYYDDKSLKSADVVFIAKDIPSIGYKTYYVEPLQQPLKAKQNKDFKSVYENNTYKITFGAGGISQIYDKELNRNLLRTDGLKGGEVFTLYSNGNGAGEFGDIQQPFMQDFDKVSAHNPQWNIIEDGDVYTTYKLEQPILYAKVQQEVTVYHTLKRVLFKTKLLNWEGVLYREFRTAFPVAIDKAQIAHEVPFGTVKVGKDEIHTAGDRYTALCKDVHPRAIMDWFSASDDEMTVTLSSSVAAIDWIDPTTENKSNTLLQHVLLASRTSCHWEGNEYSQEGNHTFQNILTSNKAGENTGERIAKQYNDPIRIVINPDKSVHATLPEHLSFFNIDADNVIVTTIKKAEDTDELVIRMYDAQGEETSVGLKSFFNIGNYKHTNIIEENPVPISGLKVPKYSIETFSFKAENH